MNAGQHDVGVDGNLAAVEFSQVSGIVEDGRRVGGICRALRVDRLCAEVVAGCVDRCGGKGSAEQQDGFFSVKGVISVSVKGGRWTNKKAVGNALFRFSIGTRFYPMLPDLHNSFGFT